MKPTTTYQKTGSVFKTYLFKFGHIRKVLVKKDGKPFEVIRFSSILSNEDGHTHYQGYIIGFLTMLAILIVISTLTGCAATQQLPRFKAGQIVHVIAHKETFTLDSLRTFKSKRLFWSATDSKGKYYPSIAQDAIK